MTLIVEKPFKWQGRDLCRGDVVDPAPQGRTLYALLDQRKVAYDDGRPSHKDEHQSTFVPHPCDEPGCTFVAVSANTLDNHWKAHHLDTPAPPDGVSVSAATPGAPAGDVGPSSASPALLACPDCDRTFAGTQGLKIHRSRAHAGA